MMSDWIAIRKSKARTIVFMGLLLAFAAAGWAQMDSLYRKPERVETRWATFENPAGEKGRGGMENKGEKGHPCDGFEPGESKTLLDTTGSGTIHRMWFTVNDRTSDTLRSLKLQVFWDGAKTPAVDVPFGDFFCALLAPPAPLQSALFSNPEGRSFNCYIPMPFRKGARVVVTNESKKRLRLLYYDIDYTIGEEHGPDMMYFHAWWHRDNLTKLGKDFEILPRVKGAGRFLGATVGIILNPENRGWWGEGEVKMYLDGDRQFPTIVGTGTEDYIGTGWGLGTYNNLYQGCLVANDKKGIYAYYRFHVPDPIYFDRDLRVTIQQMGGDAKSSVLGMLKRGVPITPVTMQWKDPKDQPDHFVRLLSADKPIDLETHDSPDNAWTNYLRRDDVCAVAYFYLDKPEEGLPPLAPVEDRIAPSAK